MSIPLAMACGEYEITRGLLDGSVRPEGVSLTCLSSDTERIFRSERRQECHISEYNLFAYFRDWEAGHDITAIPVFPHRRFRHGSIFVPAGSEAQTPADLAGSRIGIGGYQPAAAVWLRGILEEHYGLPGDSVTWYDVFGLSGELPEGLDEALPAQDPVSRYRIDDYLERGELDAVLSAYNPVGLRATPPTVRRLFPNFRDEEETYFRTTGIFPIMHVVTVRRSLVEEHPWVGANLFRAFSRAKQEAVHRLRNPRSLPLAFGQSVWQEQDQLLGPDPWQYGLGENNRRVLDTAIRYAVQQGILSRPVALDELFVPVDDEIPAGYEIR